MGSKLFLHKRRFWIIPIESGSSVRWCRGLGAAHESIWYPLADWKSLLLDYRREILTYNVREQSSVFEPFYQLILSSYFLHDLRGLLHNHALIQIDPAFIEILAWVMSLPSKLLQLTLCRHLRLINWSFQVHSVTLISLLVISPNCFESLILSHCFVLILLASPLDCLSEL